MGAIGQLVPLVLLFAFVGVFAYFGYQMYVFSNDLADRGVKKMEKKNIFIGKDGAKVGVKEVRTEDYEDKTQNVLVNTWNHASFPGFKSRIWNTDATPDFKKSARPSASRSSSSASKVKTTS